MATVFDRAQAKTRASAIFLASNRWQAPFNVSTREPASIAYWCRHFDTTPERLVEAVRRVGSNPDILRIVLRRQSARNPAAA